MPEQMRPSSKQDAPDPSNNYERSHPEREAGMGSLDSPVGKATPAKAPDKVHQAVPNRQTPEHQINAEETTPRGNESASSPKQPDHSMKDEEPLGWDQAPQDITNKQQQRHPRTEGKGGTP